jgi:multidrug efflux system outer membrane protein
MKHPANSPALRAVLFWGSPLAALSCNVGPNYERPAVASPQGYRAAGAPASGDSAPVASTAAPTDGPSLAEPPLSERTWADVFTDPGLRALIGVALRENYDARLAANRVLQAGAELDFTRMANWPLITANASAGAQRIRFGGRGDAVTAGLFQLGANVSWELDFWGKFRRANEAARAELLGSEWGRRAVTTSLVSQVATIYFELRALDRQLDIARRTLESRRESLRLTQVRETGGAGSLVDVRQAEQLVYGADAQIINLTRLIEQQENALSTLLGRDPGPVERGLDLSAQPRVTDIPTGLPSALLERRPDIQVAEQQLVAANAHIGVAKSAYFPQIGLTTSGGVASSALGALFSAPALVWSAAAGLVQPIFPSPRLDAEVELTELQRDAAVLNYRRTIQQAFREVSDALIGYQRGREYRAIQQSLLASAREARRLADLRYQGGATSYLEVLDSDTRLFVAELGVVQAELSELSAFVEIYRALGGGWVS